MLSGCTSAVNDSAICAGTAADRTAHAAALAAGGTPEALRTGRVLIQKLDAGCGDG